MSVRPAGRITMNVFRFQAERSTRVRLGSERGVYDVRVPPGVQLLEYVTI